MALIDPGSHQSGSPCIFVACRITAAIFSRKFGDRSVKQAHSVSMPNVSKIAFTTSIKSSLKIWWSEMP